MNKLSTNELDYLFSPAAIRDRAGAVFAYTQAGKGHFRYHAEKLTGVVDYVIEVIRKNYPSLDIPFHSRWGHFRAGGIDRVRDLDARLAGLDPLERARAKLDLVIPSVLLDAGAGAAWKYREGAGVYIFEAIRDSDPEAARDAMRAHINNSRSRTLDDSFEP